MTRQEFKRIRLELGLTQKALAERLGISSDICISRYENGKRKISKPLEKLLLSLVLVQ